MASTYIAKSIGVPFALNKDMLSLFNPVGSGKVIRVYRIWVENNHSINVTGVNAVLKLHRITAASGGIIVTPKTYDSTNVSLGTIVAGHGRTVTTTSLFRNYNLSNDEVVALTGSCDEWQQFKHISELWNSSTRNTNIDPIVCREDEGISIYNSTNTTVSTIDCFIEFTVT